MTGSPSQPTPSHSTAFQGTTPHVSDRDRHLAGIGVGNTATPNEQLTWLLVNVMHDVVDKKVKVAVREGMEDRDRMDRTLLTASEVADTFSIAQRTLRYWRKRMPSFPRPLRFGRRLLFRRADIESYLAQQNPPAHKPAAAP